MQSFEDEEDPREQKKMENRREKRIVKDEEEWTKTPARPRHPGDVSAHLQELVLLWLLLGLLSSSQRCLLDIL